MRIPRLLGGETPASAMCRMRRCNGAGLLVTWVKSALSPQRRREHRGCTEKKTAMTVQIYPQNPTARFVDSVVPQGSVAAMANPVVQKLIQLAQLPFSGCTPQNAGIKLRESFAHINPNSL